MEIFYAFIFLTAVLFTAFGYSIGRKTADRKVVEIAISTTIDNLISEGYLRTRGSGADMEILKVNYDEADRT